MLTISPSMVCYIILKAREFDEAMDYGEPNEGPTANEDMDLDSLENRDSETEDPSLEELSGAIMGLNDDEKSDLVALTWVGRGDYPAEDWSEARSQAANASTKHFPDYLTGMPQLGDLLEEGLAALGYSCEDHQADRL